MLFCLREMIKMNEFQYRLQKAIAAKGITASELSRLSGVGKSDISNYINGVYIAKQDKCFLLAEALGVDPGWLMTGDEPTDQHVAGTVSTAEARIISGGIDRMPPDKREQALKVMQAIFSEYFYGGNHDGT